MDLLDASGRHLETVADGSLATDLDLGVDVLARVENFIFPGISWL